MLISGGFICSIKQRGEKIRNQNNGIFFLKKTETVKLYISGSRATVGAVPSRHFGSPEGFGKKVPEHDRAKLQHHWRVPAKSESRYYHISDDLPWESI